mmetsp:Transcript_70955/g.178950  ORF Transcript_70955/g.178950 Transcript_70955/m.178950 type:complete len:419 (+) Transcript_70955:80-1336(+)
MAPTAVRGMPRLPMESRGRILGGSVLVASALLVSQCGFAIHRSVGLRASVAGRPQQARSLTVASRKAVADPVNNVSPEMSAAGRRYAEKYEEIFLAGNRLWTNLKKKAEQEGTAPKKIYFIGPAGNSAHEICESTLDALAYIPAPDGTMFLYRKPGISYPKTVYWMAQSDKLVSQKSKISPPDLFMDDEEKYRDLEAEAIREFDALPFSDHPQAMVVGESAVLRDENVEIMKKGLVIWLDAEPEFTWLATQFRPRQGGGLYVPPDFQQRPPVWALANGWDGDVDDAEGKMDYTEIAQGLAKKYEEIADLRIKADVEVVVQNSYYGAQRIVAAMSDLYGFAKEGDASIDEEMIEKDLEKFLEGARLSKYLKSALEWCDEQGAASIEDVVENVPEFSDAMGLKPLERKRLEKAAASMASA